MNSTQYRLLQLVNSNIGAVAPGQAMPFGVVNREVELKCNRDTFEVGTTGANIVYIEEPGFYTVVYSANITVAAAGDIILNLVIGGVTVYTATFTVAAAGTHPISFTFSTRAFRNFNGLPNNLPLSVQVISGTTGVAITGGSSILNIQRPYDDC